ncbi:C-type lectin protein [Coniochaeta sp. 2T2.1]|nr:C-type lectin protein [Coniochaeta sp. 2T2.1]
MPAADISTEHPSGSLSHLKGGGDNYIRKAEQSSVNIIDIRRKAVEINIKEDILTQFHSKTGPRTLPTLLLYSERGLQLFEDITYLDEYYLTNDEIALLEAHSAEIAKHVPSGSMVIELGSGNLRKVNLLLQALENAEKRVDYYALDLSRTELERTLAQVPSYRYVKCRGLLGTYDDGREWLRRPENVSRRKCILSLGSSIGNFHRDDAADFLRTFGDVLQHGDGMLIGLDGCDDPAKVYHAYNDGKGLTHEFVLNGLWHANEIIGHEAFTPGDWKVIGEYVFDNEGGRHQAFYAPIRDTVVMGELIRAHERIQVEQSLKYSQAETARLWSLAGMTEVKQWKFQNEYGLHMLARSKMPFPLIPKAYANSPLPSLEDWKALWASWDVVTQQMIPDEELLSKPIKLRNACIFYLGHIPTFLDVQLHKATGEPLSGLSAYYQTIFERGIDPDVDNPEKCHDHSEIPPEYPPLQEILHYQDTVRDTVRKLYGGKIESIPRNVGRAIWVGFEHEIMHLETLLYMMLQSDKTRPPPHTEVPDWEKLAEKARSARVENEWFDVPAQEITLGIDEPDDATDVNLNYGWDNEKPERKAQVHAFQAQGRPITNEEYARYMYDQHITHIPASWAETKPETNGTTNGTNGHSNGHSNGTTELPKSFLEGKSVRTVYGLVPLQYALDWPVFASYDELKGCAAYLGGRIPTFEEARSIYRYAETMKDEKAERQLGKTVPAVNGHLSSNGVEETPPSHPAAVDGEVSSLSHEDLFLDLDGGNVGFQHWHPVPVTANGNRLAGQSEMGGVWEWTSSPLEKWDGFEPMSIYPGYTADFFDGKHNIVLGGSWATHPRIAGRKSFVNWYQRNYPYAWCGARLVRDIN